MLNCNGYTLELELNEDKKRVVIYIAQSIEYIRRKDLEETGCHVVIIDVELKTKFCIIALYHSFRPPVMSPAQLFIKQVYSSRVVAK